MKVLMRSHLTDTNPYLMLLVNALSSVGITVVPALTGHLFLIRSYLKHGRPDIFHLQWHHGYFSGNTLPVAIFRTTLFLLQLLGFKLIGVRLVWTVHNVINHEKHLAHWELLACRLLARLVDAIIVHCGSAVSIVARAYKISQTVIHVVPHGHYSDAYPLPMAKYKARTALGLPHSKRIFLYFGQIRDYKGVESLLEAFVRLESDNVCLIIAGQPKTARLRNVVEEAAKQDSRIQLHLDFLDDELLVRYLSAADLAVLPYKEVLTSGAVILASSVGCPLLIPSIGCLCDYDPAAAIFYDPEVEQSLVRALKEGLSAPVETMGVAAHKHVQSATWPLAAAKTVETYYAICGT